jgi:hypothetical protein
MQGDGDARVLHHAGRQIDLILPGEPVDVRPLVAVRHRHCAGAHGTIHLRDAGQLTLRAADDHRLSVGDTGGRRVVGVDDDLDHFTEEVQLRVQVPDLPAGHEHE